MSNIVSEPYFDNVSFMRDVESDVLTDLELKLILDVVYSRYGYDFSEYSNSILKRRLLILKNENKLRYFSDLISLLLHRRSVFEQFVRVMSVSVTQFFRDPEFFLQFKVEVLPLLESYPFITLWCAGCATGEEAYTWAILLDEAGLLGRSRIYATDINNDVLTHAAQGIYSSTDFETGAENYQRFSGEFNLNHYGQLKYGSFKVKSYLANAITFAQHNLVQDGVFGEMNVVSCRNVMIYFSRQLKSRCLQLFQSSLIDSGYLCLGQSEAIDNAIENTCFKPLKVGGKIYKCNTLLV